MSIYVNGTINMSKDLQSYQRTADTECYYSYPVTISTSTLAIVANTLYAIPYISGVSEHTADQIAINVTSGVSGNAKLGIYNDNGNMYPNNLILDAGTVSTTSTGVKTISISQKIFPNRLYWLVIVCDVTPTIRALGNTSVAHPLGMSSTIGTLNTQWSVAFVYAALPNPFTGGGAMLSSAPVGIFLRFSS